MAFNLGNRCRSMDKDLWGTGVDLMNERIKNSDYSITEEELDHQIEELKMKLKLSKGINWRELRKWM